MKYILDTNICIYIIKRKPVAVLEKFITMPLGSIGISTITLAELDYGVEKSLHKERNRQALNEFIVPLEIFEFNRNAALAYGIIRADLEKSGNIIGAMDMLIAAHSLSLNMTIATNNEHEFKRVKGIMVENWTV